MAADGSETWSDKWKRYGSLLFILIFLLCVSYYPTFESMIAIWIRSETYAHGFIIAPISFWLIWRVRKQLLRIEPAINYLGVPVLIVLGMVWLLASYIDVLAVQQLAVVLMIPALVFSVLGFQVVTALSFPLLFLLFSVPLGEELTPVLIDFTADFTVEMVKLVGVPVYREGNFLQLPTGNWSVVSACSGVRYLIASVTLGLLYAYLNYQSMTKKVVFVIASFVVPIIANGLRAFIIVMLGHLSDMKIATGVDHLIYGWVFFGIVIGLMFFIGSYWWDVKEEPKLKGLKWSLGALEYSKATGKVVVVCIGLAVVAWPAKLQLDNKIYDTSGIPQLTIPISGAWKSLGSEWSWKPDYHGTSHEFSGSYQNANGEKVNVYVGYYADQRQGSELGNYNNVLVSEKNHSWRVIDNFKLPMSLPVDKIQVPAAILRGSTSKMMVAYYYYVDGEIVTHKYMSKLQQAKTKLFGNRSDGAVVFISTIHTDNSDKAENTIRNFAIEVFPQIQSALEKMRG